jgi:precorrin-6A/cobalt-precorrin-6A reductase
MRVLLLGGTAEAREAAARLYPRTDIVSSLAGRVPDPTLPAGPVRIGGFGGVAGLRAWLTDSRITAVLDATHPFAGTITANAARACAELGLAHLVLVRPAWDPGSARLVASVAEAAGVVAAEGFSRVFLTTGRSGVGEFREADAWFLIRVVTAPRPGDLPRRAELVVSRGPYRYDDELALMRGHRIDALVTKNSGGEHTRAKLDAAETLGAAVVMIERPPLPAGVAVTGSVGEAVDWVLNRGTGAG